MSRKGKLPIVLGDKVNVEIKGQEVTVSGPKGTLKKAFHPCVALKLHEGVLSVHPLRKDRLTQAMYGTARAILANMVQGVTQPFSKDLEIQGVGFKANLNGQRLDLALGYSHPIQYPLPQGITVTIKDNTKLHVEGADKHLVGQVAADIKQFYPVEPYKGKGVRIVGQFVRRKEGKKKA